MIGRNVAQRLKRLEVALTPATPQILTIRHITVGTGAIRVQQVELLEPHRSRRARAWAEPAPNERRL
jgi:hypothetical protein